MKDLPSSGPDHHIQYFEKAWSDLSMEQQMDLIRKLLTHARGAKVEVVLNDQAAPWVRKSLGYRIVRDE